MEPIPLRALTVLLNYERMISDPRFKGERLMNWSIVDPPMVQRIMRSLWEVGQLIDEPPESIRKTETSIFAPHTESWEAEEEHPSTLCLVHPNASPVVKALTDSQLESLFYETRGHDGCYKAIGMYQYFFDLCSPEQKLSIQITNEKPVLIEKAPRGIILFAADRPKRMTVASIPNKQYTMYNGTKNGEDHVVLSFPTPGAAGKFVVVDMTRMQYGEAGRGAQGEPYYLGFLSDFRSASKMICENLHARSLIMKPLPEGDDAANRDRLRNCAQRAFDRWQNRANESWCDYCGKGGKDLKQCSGCKERKIKYCCRRHQVVGWKLHKHTCERVK